MQTLNPNTAARRFSKWRDRRSRVDRDVRRTDRAQPFFAGEGNRNVRTLRSVLLTYSLYNFDLSYCQGMSDLAAPLLFVMRDEAETFWCFAALMDRLEARPRRRPRLNRNPGSGPRLT